MLDSVAVKMDGLAEQYPGPDFRHFPVAASHYG
jgi:hypothetical protein